MDKPIGSLAGASAATLWHLWWPKNAPASRLIKDPAFVLHTSLEVLLSALKESPESALSIHPSVTVTEVEKLLLGARKDGWTGPWAAAIGWLEEHRWLEKAFGNALEIKSWNDFLEDPWPAVGRGRINPGTLSNLTDSYSLNQLPGAMVVIDNGAVVQHNDAFSSLIGLSHDALFALPLSQFWSEEGAGQAFILRLRAAAGEGEWFAEANWERSDRRAITVELRCRFIGDLKQNRRRWMIAVNDISRRQRALDYMQLQRELVERASSAILILEMNEEDPQPRICFANPSWEQISGFCIEDTIGMKLSALDKQGGEFSFSETMQTVMERGQSTFITAPCGRKDGPGFWADVTLFPIGQEEKGVVRFVAIIHDVTERVEAERHLKASERRFRLLFKDNQLPMFLHEETTGTIVDCNLSASKFCGCERDALIGKNISDLASDEVEILGATGEQNYHAHRHADGSFRYVLVYQGDFQVESEQVVRYSILVDCTAQHEAELGLLEAMDAMQTANRAKSDFLQIVGHEIRTPMNAILGFSELLRGAIDEAEREESLSMIEDGARNLLRVVESVVDYIDGSDHTLEDFQLIGLEDFCETSSRLYSQTAEEKGLEFSIQVSSECPEILSIPENDYRKVLGYVLDNAIKFTSDGRIDLQVSVEPQEQVLVFTVSDTGSGIAEDKLETLFEPFTASDMSTEREHEGLGMGLAICGKLVKLYQGSITCKSSCSTGSIFTIKLPFKD